MLRRHLARASGKIERGLPSWPSVRCRGPHGRLGLFEVSSARKPRSPEHTLAQLCRRLRVLGYTSRRNQLLRVPASDPLPAVLLAFVEPCRPQFPERQTCRQMSSRRRPRPSQSKASARPSASPISSTRRSRSGCCTRCAAPPTTSCTPSRTSP
jgi:hypothetical protein